MGSGSLNPTARPTATLPGAGAKLPGALRGGGTGGGGHTHEGGDTAPVAVGGVAQPTQPPASHPRGVPAGWRGGLNPTGKGFSLEMKGKGGGGGHGTQQGVAGSEGAGSLGARWPVDAVGRQAKTCRGWAGPGRRSRQQHVPSRRSGRPWIPDPVEGPHRRCGCGCPPLPHAPPPPTLPPPRRSVAMGSGQHRRDGVGGGGCCLGKREGGGGTYGSKGSELPAAPSSSAWRGR